MLVMKNVLNVFGKMALVAIFLFGPMTYSHSDEIGYLIENIESNPVTSEDIQCMAKNIYHEARGEPLAGQYAVAHVTMNRVKSDRYPNTICKVVYQPYQFSWANHGEPRIKDKVSWTRSVKIAEEVIYHLTTDDVTNGATHFHMDYVHPRWMYKLKRTVKIGNHIFYR